MIEKLVNFSPFLVRIILCNSLFFKAHCYHLEAPGPVPRLAPGQLAHVAEDGGGLGQGHVTVHQNWDLLERKLGPFPIFSPDESILYMLSLTVRTYCHSLEELDADLLVGDGSGPQQQQGGAERMGDAVTKQL